MSIHVEWDNTEKTVVRWVFDGDWSWKELHDTVVGTYHMYDEVDHKVDAILDLRRAPRVPGNAIANAKDLIEKRHPNAGKTVFVGTSPIFNNLWAMFNRVYSLVIWQKEAIFLFANTLEEAQDALQADNRTPSRDGLE